MTPSALPDVPSGAVTGSRSHGWSGRKPGRQQHRADPFGAQVEPARAPPARRPVAVGGAARPRRPGRSGDVASTVSRNRCIVRSAAAIGAGQVVARTATVAPVTPVTPADQPDPARLQRAEVEVAAPLAGLVAPDELQRGLPPRRVRVGHSSMVRASRPVLSSHQKTSMPR